MNLIVRLKEWIQKRRDFKAKQFSDEFTDIIKLSRKGFISVKATGQTITDIYAKIQSRVHTPLKIHVLHGTYFVSSGNHQNMVTRKEYKFTLDPLEIQNIKIPASCINANLPIPNEKDSFNGVAKVSDQLTKFLIAAEGEDAMTIQAGVWAITDGYTASQIKQRLRITRTYRYGSMPFHPSNSESAISDLNIIRAKEVLIKVGIRTNL
jgi:hypothetical protein